MFFLEWNEWKNPQFNFSSQNLSIERNFFKWDGKETKISHLLFHRIWKIMYVVRSIIWSKSNISFIILVQLKECQIPFYKWTKYLMYVVYLLSRSIETWISHLFFEAKKHEHEKVTQSLIAGCWFLKISNEKTNFCWILVCQKSSVFLKLSCYTLLGLQMSITFSNLPVVLWKISKCA